MKKLFTLLVLSLIATWSFSQEFSPLLVDNGADTLSTQHAATQVVDVNNDGTLDIIISGENGAGAANGGIFISGGDKTFSLSTETNEIATGFLACMGNGDIDGDGDLDIIFNGWVPGVDNQANAGVAINNGSGAFALDATYEMLSSAPGCGFAELNNDGLLDYYSFGKGAGACAIYFQNTDGTFTKEAGSFASFDFIDAEISVIDFNNDGYLDMFINGWEINSDSRFSKLLINDQFGGFTVSAQANIKQKGFGSATWYDVNADGHLDLLLNGDGGADGEASSDIFRLYKNNAGTLEEAAVFNDYRQISVGGGAKFADLDNDGDADIILTGWSNTEGRQVTIIEECTDAANFTYVRHTWSDSDQVPGVSESDVAIGDFNNDHKIDFVVSGFSGNFGRKVAGVVFNTMATANTLPGAPTNLAVADISGGGLTFSWDAGTDAETPVAALTYSMYLKDVTNSKILMNPKANLTNGKRMVCELGNLDNSLTWPIYELPDGDYEWTVQTVDGAYEGSSFASTQNFTLLGGVLTGIDNELKEIDLANIYTNGDQLEIRLMDAVKDAKVSVYEIDGRLRCQKQMLDSNASIQLNMGIYVVQIINRGEMTSKKVVITK